MKYVTKKMIVALNRLVITRTGGLFSPKTNIRSGQNLGFVERIHANTLFGCTLYPTIYHQAAAYLHSVVKMHVFLDGNKRTGLASAVTFLQWNGIFLKQFDESLTYEMIIELSQSTASSEQDIDRFADWFQKMRK